MGVDAASPAPAVMGRRRATSSWHLLLWPVGQMAVSLLETSTTSGGSSRLGTLQVSWSLGKRAKGGRMVDRRWRWLVIVVLEFNLDSCSHRAGSVLSWDQSPCWKLVMLMCATHVNWVNTESGLSAEVGRNFIDVSTSYKCGQDSPDAADDHSNCDRWSVCVREQKSECDTPGERSSMKLLSKTLKLEMFYVVYRTYLSLTMVGQIVYSVYCILKSSEWPWCPYRRLEGVRNWVL